MSKINLPADGTIVTAYTYPSDEYDRQAYQVSGKLFTRWVHSLEYTQCWVNNVQVDSSTIKPVESQTTEQPTIDNAKQYVDERKGEVLNQLQEKYPDKNVRQIAEDSGML